MVSAALTNNQGPHRVVTDWNKQFVRMSHSATWVNQRLTHDLTLTSSFRDPNVNYGQFDVGIRASLVSDVAQLNLKCSAA